MNEVKLRKSGTFYNVFDEDIYILYYLFGYSIKDNKCGFPISALDKVIDKLDELKINYNIVSDNISKNYKSANRYNKYKELGIKKHKKDIYLNDIINKLQNINDDKFNIIYNYIKNYIEE